VRENCESKGKKRAMGNMKRGERNDNHGTSKIGDGDQKG
jgi:hypothetical protein